MNNDVAEFLLVTVLYGSIGSAESDVAKVWDKWKSRVSAEPGLMLQLIFAQTGISPQGLPIRCSNSNRGIPLSLHIAPRRTECWIFVHKYKALQEYFLISRGYTLSYPD